jgi:hypothetical protein
MHAIRNDTAVRRFLSRPVPKAFSTMADMKTNKISPAIEIKVESHSPDFSFNCLSLTVCYLLVAVISA